LELNLHTSKRCWANVTKSTCVEKSSKRWHKKCKYWYCFSFHEAW